LSAKASITPHIEHILSINHLPKNRKGKKIDERLTQAVIGTTLSKKMSKTFEHEEVTCYSTVF